LLFFFFFLLLAVVFRLFLLICLESFLRIDSLGSGNWWLLSILSNFGGRAASLANILPLLHELRSPLLKLLLSLLGLSHSLLHFLHFLGGASGYVGLVEWFSPTQVGRSTFLVLHLLKWSARFGGHSVLATVTVLELHVDVGHLNRLIFVVVVATIFDLLSLKRLLSLGSDRLLLSGITLIGGHLLIDFGRRVGSRLGDVLHSIITILTPSWIVFDIRPAHETRLNVLTQLFLDFCLHLNNLGFEFLVLGFGYSKIVGLSTIYFAYAREQVLPVLVNLVAKIGRSDVEEYQGADHDAHGGSIRTVEGVARTGSWTQATTVLDVFRMLFREAVQEVGLLCVHGLHVCER